MDGGFNHQLARVLPLSAALLIAMAPGCTDEKIIEVERPFFDDPPAGAVGFLGYDEEATNLTTCGNCHIGQQSEWEDTAHADAWMTLANSGGARDFCEGCHTVGPRGNATSAPGGWATTRDPRYHDVQCESCHGPGETHVANPDASQPQASIAVGSDLTSGCGECHSGNHHPFVEEWEQSAHAQVVGFAAARPECESCHKGQGTLAAWGVTDNYVEKNSSEALPVVCAVCHDPHDATHAGQLRFPVETTSVEEHLCARCHDRRTSPNPNSSHGLEPHAPETDLLLGVSGWFPPDAIIDEGQIRSTHGSDRNPKLCATCHVNMFTVTDAETGDFIFNATGHLFTAIPCVDAQGVPTPGECDLTTQARSFQGCTTGACHGSEDAALSALILASARVDDRSETLLAQLEQVDPNLDGPGGEIDASNPTFTVAEGAFFNYNLANFGGSSIGSTAHNPFLVEGLLIASIQAVEDEYGVAANVRVDWTTELQSVLAKARR